LFVVMDVQVTSWEDGESPALKIGPGEEKWIRIEGKFDGRTAKRFLELKIPKKMPRVMHVSLELLRWVDDGWFATPSRPFPLIYTVKANLERYCKSSGACK